MAILTFSNIQNMSTILSEEQAQLGCDLAQEYEGGKSPEWEYVTELGTVKPGKCSGRLAAALCRGFKIRRVDPYRHLKEAWEAGKEMRIRGSSRWIKKGSSPDYFLWLQHPDQYEIRLDWTLPAPPDGYEWHRTDWTRDMLPEGYRPLYVGETGPYEFSNDKVTWYVMPGLDNVPTQKSIITEIFYRTNEPLPKPLKWVDLDKADVPPGSWLRSQVGGEYAVTARFEKSVRLAGEDMAFDKRLKDLRIGFWQINRSLSAGAWDEKAWEPCRKQVPAE
jgi:hypothetical protein